MPNCPVCHAILAEGVSVCPKDGALLWEPESLFGRLVDGKYRVESLLGSGAVGAVFRATQLDLERPVALKVVRPEAAANPVSLKRFKREAVALGRIKHPNIVTIHDSGTIDDAAAYIVMELVDGHSLRDEIQQVGHLDVAVALRLMAQMCSAVQAAHDVGVIHRDLKPENVMLEEHSDGAVAKVLDFGTAKLAGERDAGRTTLTSHKTKLGTPLYMSPEQASGKEASVHSDVYSLGCIFYEMLTGVLPFTGKTIAMILLKHRGERPKPPSMRLATLPDWVDPVVLRALEKAPADRFGSAAEFASALPGS
jgi:eukaryotic-like serine/threonine-protein kinase